MKSYKIRKIEKLNPMDRVDETDEQLLLFQDIVLEQGKIVAERYWDSGGPGGGAGVVRLYEFRNCFFGFTEDEFRGPFDNLEEACDVVALRAVTSATKRITINGEVIFERGADK